MGGGGGGRAWRRGPITAAADVPGGGAFLAGDHPRRDSPQHCHRERRRLFFERLLHWSCWYRSDAASLPAVRE